MKLYYLPTNDGEKYTEWFMHSYSFAIKQCPAHESPVDFYQHFFGFKIFVTADPVISHVEFPDEETAIMFVMRWS